MTRSRFPAHAAGPAGRVLAAALLLTSACSLDVDNSTTVPTQAEAYVLYVLNQMQTHATRRASVDWANARADVMALVDDDMLVEDTYPAIARALGLLGDGTSTFVTAERDVLTGVLPACTAPAVADVSVPADIAYIRVDTISRPGTPSVEYAAAMQERIRAADREGVAGWIVDLRGNGHATMGLEGMWAMLGGLGPVLGNGTAGYNTPSSGALTLRPWGYANGVVNFGTEAMLIVGTPYTLRTPGQRVAILTDRATARAGEAMAVSFRGRENARSFGATTCGVPLFKTAFSMFDGGSLDLATGFMTARNETAYSGPLQPDEAVVDPDAALQRAIAWVRSGS